MLLKKNVVGEGTRELLPEEEEQAEGAGLGGNSLLLPGLRLRVLLPTKDLRWSIGGNFKEAEGSNEELD